ncbi:unnamed protein product [Vitrella brassicaformis CCMP3155]|uniref:Fibronectin type-III domain-containing protein n=1 Tax=Vitrella brassicaformis (strain CCMP3155) TaxID=1169540 RepID=A0A0G4ECQ9_VITBC|nr:unnamed protein product [Vitrella brassicaformis CCMP3155]|eukprot:CEL93761.1 unnamed protein product [Vitrella brassicaformis CCMP3155]
MATSGVIGQQPEQRRGSVAHGAYKEPPRRTESKASLVRQSSASLLRTSSKPSIIRKNSASLLFPKEDEEDLVIGPGIELVYFSGWKQPYLHYKDHNGKWTEVPGLPFEKSTRNDFNGPEVWYLCIRDAKEIEFVPNSGSNQWDKAPGNRNYSIPHPGLFKLQAGRIEQIMDPPGCPALLAEKEVGGSFVKLVWAPPLFGAEVVGCYRVYRDGEMVYQTAEEDEIEYTDRHVLGMHTYTYTVTAVNIQGAESRAGDPLKVKTGQPGKPSAPQDLKVDQHSSKFVKLSWRSPADHGGKRIAAYRIWRDGVVVGVCGVTVTVGQEGSKKIEPPSPDQREMFQDDKVVKDKTYSYQITALHERPADPPSLAVGDAALGGEPESTRRKDGVAGSGEQIENGEGSPKRAKPDLPTEGIACEPVVVKAVDMLQVVRLGEKKPHIVFQGFNWNSPHNRDGWYKVIIDKMDLITKSAFTMVWLPPPAQSVDANGYLPQGWYNLNSKYGSADELKTLLGMFRENGISPMCDVVVNHRCAVRKGSSGNFTEFEQPDWGSWAICSNDPKMPGKGAPSTGETIEYAPDIDHTNPQVQRDVKQWLNWLTKEVGFATLRLDFVLGYAPKFQIDYIKSVGNPFTVAEYWHGDQRVLQNYIHATQGMVAVFDFPMYYFLRTAIQENNFSDIAPGGRLNGIMGLDPVRSVTFIENHDTCHLDVVGGPFGNNEQVTRAYAFILTHPGTPSVFWSDWSDRGSHVQGKIIELCNIRKDKGIHCRSGVHVAASHGGLYAAYVSPDYHCGHGGGNVAIKIGTNHWGPDGGNWKVACSGHEFCVWTR